MFIIASSSVVASSAFENNNAYDIHYDINYLTRYGYVPDNTIDSLRLTTTDNVTSAVNASVISSYLRIFQENYNLTANGELNNETLTLMRERRCCNEDFLSPSYIFRTLWTKRRLTWRFVHGTVDAIGATRQAFAIWQKHSNLEFDY